MPDPKRLLAIRGLSSIPSSRNSWLLQLQSLLLLLLQRVKLVDDVVARVSLVLVAALVSVASKALSREKSLRTESVQLTCAKGGPFV